MFGSRGAKEKEVCEIVGKDECRDRKKRKPKEKRKKIRKRQFRKKKKNNFKKIAAVLKREGGIGEIVSYFLYLRDFLRGAGRKSFNLLPQNSMRPIYVKLDRRASKMFGWEGSIASVVRDAKGCEVGLCTDGFGASVVYTKKNNKKKRSYMEAFNQGE